MSHIITLPDLPRSFFQSSQRTIRKPKPQTASSVKRPTKTPRVIQPTQKTSIGMNRANKKIHLLSCAVSKGLHDAYVISVAYKYNHLPFKTEFLSDIDKKRLKKASRKGIMDATYILSFFDLSQYVDLAVLACLRHPYSCVYVGLRMFDKMKQMFDSIDDKIDLVIFEMVEPLWRQVPLYSFEKARQLMQLHAETNGYHLLSETVFNPFLEAPPEWRNFYLINVVFARFVEQPLPKKENQKTQRALSLLRTQRHYPQSHPEIFNLFLQAAEEGDTQAEYFVSMFDFWIHQNSDRIRAAKKFQPNFNSDVRYGSTLSLPIRKFHERIKYLQRAADKGHLDSFFILYYQFQNVDKEVLEYFSENGVTQAKFLLGVHGHRKLGTVLKEIIRSTNDRYYATIAMNICSMQLRSQSENMNVQFVPLFFQFKKCPFTNQEIDYFSSAYPRTVSRDETLVCPGAVWL